MQKGSCGLKKCTKCGETKPLEQFSKNKTKKDGLHSNCKSCDVAYHVVRAKRHRENPVTYSVTDTKLCGTCKQIKSTIEFSKSTRAKDGLQGSCKACKAAWRTDHPELCAAYSVNRQREHPEQYAAYCAARRAKKKLSKEDHAESIAHRKAIKDDFCYYCEQRSIYMEYDHVIPLSRGGTDRYWNIVRCCQTCNRRKGSMTDIEYLATMPYR